MEAQDKFSRFNRHLERKKSHELELLELISQKKEVKPYCYSLWTYNQAQIINQIFNNNNIPQAKQHSYVCGLIDEYRTNKFDAQILSYGTGNIGYALLSDNHALIERYANLTFTHYMALIEKGHCSLVYAVQCIIKEDWQQLKWLLEIMDKKILVRQKTSLPDRELFEGIMNNNKQQIEKSLAQLIKNHKRRNKYNELINEFISHPALGYAKLAWLKGIKVEVDSPLVPKEILPVKPLENYEIPYDFLKE